MTKSKKNRRSSNRHGETHTQETNLICKPIVQSQTTPFGVTVHVDCACGGFATNTFSAEAAEVAWEQHMNERVEALTVLLESREVSNVKL